MTDRVRRGLCCLVAFAMLAPAARAQPATPAATPAITSPPLDLAAMALTPADLEALGFTGFLVADGRTQTLEDRATQEAEEDEADLEEVEAYLLGLGWVRGYRARLAHPTTAGEEDFDALISSGVTQLADDAGARSAFELVSELDVRDGSATPVADAATIGDLTAVLDLGEVTLDDGTAHPGIRVVFQHGALLGDVTAFAPPGEPLGAEDGEALAARLLERMDDVLASGGPGLSVKVLRWQGLGLADPDLDNYLLLDDEEFGILGDSAEERADNADEFGAATDRYRYEAALTESLFQFTTVARFPAAEEAGRWVQEAFARADEDREAGTELEVVADAPDFGDESVAMRAASPLGDQDLVAYAVFARVGDEVISLAVASLDSLDAADVWTMAEAQLACFAAGDCTAAAAPPRRP